MRKSLLVTALGLLALFLVTSCGDEDTSDSSKVQLGDGDSGRTVTIAKNDTLIVSLTSNPSTGFSWSVRDAVPAQLQSQGKPKFVAATTASPVVGAAGTQVFTFRAAQQGTATLFLDYARSFEKGVPPEKSWSVTIAVK